MKNILTVPEHEEKMAKFYGQFHPLEKFQDELLEVKSFLVSVKDGHGHKLSVQEAIEKVDGFIGKVGRMIDHIGAVEIIKEG